MGEWGEAGLASQETFGVTWEASPLAFTRSVAETGGMLGENPMAESFAERGPPCRTSSHSDRQIPRGGTRGLSQGPS